MVLLAAVLVTALAAFSAFQLEASFDVKDFFKSNSDFVVSLDKIDEHVSRSGGEPATIYIRGDLADPAALERDPRVHGPAGGQPLHSHKRLR